MANWAPTAVDLATDTTTVSTTPVVVKGVYINTVLSAQPCNINNGSTTIFIIEASKAAGSVIDFAGDDGVLFDTSLIIDPDNAATGNLTILYKDRV